MKRSLAVLGIVALTVLMVGATAVKADDTPIVKGDGGKIRLMYNPAGTNSYPPYAIQKFGLDKKHGFELVSIPSATTQSMVTGFQSSGTDIGMFGWNDLVRAKNGGVAVVGIAPFLAFGVDPVIVQKDSPLQNIGELKGKKVGVIGMQGINTLAMEALARQKYHFDLMKESYLQSGAPPLLWALLDQGQLDATLEFNSLEPAMLATGKFRQLTSVKDITNELGLPDTPYLLYVADTGYAAAHPQNVKAFLAAYRDAVDILKTNDQPWSEHGKEQQMSDAVIAIFRDEARADMMTTFTPTTKADITKVFTMLLETAGPDAMGMTELRPDFMTLDYQ